MEKIGGIVQLALNFVKLLALAGLCRKRSVGISTPDTPPRQRWITGERRWIQVADTILRFQEGGEALRGRRVPEEGDGAVLPAGGGGEAALSRGEVEVLPLPSTGRVHLGFQVGTDHR